MNNIKIKMSLLMGVTLSFCLSLFGNLTSGHFTIPAFILSFIISFIISMLIGVFIPAKKISDGIISKKGMDEHSLPARLIETLISDIIYTPIITFAMVFLAYKNATAHGAKMPFLPEFIKSLILSFIIAFVIIFIVTPVFIKIAIGKQGRK